MELAPRPSSANRRESVDAGHIYVADTNNYAIRLAALATLEVSALEIKGLK
jgi:hypothetical protein